jgi:AsmA-like C-terminal region
MLKKILVAVAIVLAVGLFLLTRTYDSPELGRKVLGAVGKATGLQVSASGFRLNLLHGLELTGVRGQSQSEGRTMDLSLDRLVFEHRLGPLLSGTIAIDRIVLERPQVRVEETATTARGPEAPKPDEPEAKGAPIEDDGFVLQIQQVSIVDATLSLGNGTGESTVVTGLDFELRNITFDPRARSLAALSGRGELRIDEGIFDSLKLEDVQSQFGLRDARFEMSQLSFRTPLGPFSGTMNLDFNPVPFSYSLDAKGDPLDLNRLVDATGGLGPASIALAAEGEGTSSKDMKARGTVRLGKGALPEASLFRGIDQALGKSVVVGAPYETTDARFRLDESVVHLDPFRFETKKAMLALEGRVSLDGPMDLSLDVATAREGIQIAGVGASVLDVLSDDRGWIPIPMHVSGTTADPKVRPDGKALAAQAGHGAKREAKERASDAVRNRIHKKN